MELHLLTALPEKITSKDHSFNHVYNSSFEHEELHTQHFTLGWEAAL